MKHCVPKPLRASRFLFSRERLLLLWVAERLLGCAQDFQCCLVGAHRTAPRVQRCLDVCPVEAFPGPPQALARSELSLLSPAGGAVSGAPAAPPCPPPRSLPPQPGEASACHALLVFSEAARFPPALPADVNHYVHVIVYATCKLSNWVLCKRGNPKKKPKNKNTKDCVITEFLNISNAVQLSQIKISSNQTEKAIYVVN